MATAVEVKPTALRLNRHYIIIYVHWVWTISTGVIPFIALLILNCKIFSGLKSVRRNLQRHQRLAEASEQRTIGSTNAGIADDEDAKSCRVNANGQDGARGEAQTLPRWRSDYSYKASNERKYVEPSNIWIGDANENPSSEQAVPVLPFHFSTQSTPILL